MIIGYVNSSLTKEQRAIIENVSDRVIDSNKLSIKESLLKQMQPTDQLLVFDFYSLNLTLSQYGRILDYFDKKNLDITFINLTDYDRNLLDKLVNHEASIVRKKVNKGIVNARNQGRIGGRPTVNEDIKNKIITCRKDEKMTIREIALVLDVSIGTVHKYLKLID